jgi:8-hydroxy-5-deazaflavin:NADPH oxidoreductase
VYKHMNVTIIGASDTFARGLATWAIAAEHDVTIVGFDLGQAESLVRTITRARAAGPSDPLLDHLIFMAMPYSCVLDARDFYGKQLDDKIVVDVTTPIHLDTFEPIHPEAGSVAQEIAKALPRARVVKAFNPKFAGTLFPDEDLSQETRDVFLARDDVEAKRVVAKLFKKGGLHPIDVGPLRRARELEAAGYLNAARRTSVTSGWAADRPKA